MYRKNTAQQLFNISEDIYKSFYHIVFLEVCRAYEKKNKKDTHCRRLCKTTEIFVK